MRNRFNYGDKGRRKNRKRGQQTLEKMTKTSQKNEQFNPLEKYQTNSSHIFVDDHRPSDVWNELANPAGLLGMLVYVLSVLGNNDELLSPSTACHLCNACGKVMPKSIPDVSSEFSSDGFQSSARDDNTLTT